MGKALSVVIAALDTYKEVEEVHSCVEDQTIRGELEVILVCKTQALLKLPESFCSKFPDVLLVEGGESVLLNEARHLGILKSTTPYVAIMEDHCLPLPDCLEHMYNRLKEGWSGVGPSIRQGNRVLALPRAANYVTYGEWMGRKHSGEAKYIAGFNSAFSKDVLLSRQEQLRDDLIATSLMQASLKKEGHKFFLETGAIMYHWEASYWSGVRSILIPNGEALGVLRSRGWGLLKRLAFTAFIPCLFASRYLRALCAYWRAVESGSSVAEFLYLLPVTWAWSYGEMKGYWSNGRRAFRTASDVERNRGAFVSPDEPILKPY